ncbi:C40 family peptidase [Candidatus Kaiserbacteria bacterium]|nr:C40 family peptidase [Candidatus Kaiserbacteria bacterium]
MLVSYKWLERFFDDPLPAPETIAEKLTFGAFEIESIAKKGDDTIIDVKVLPDRACYALSHRGIAREVATLCGIAMKDPIREPHPALEPKTADVSVTVEDTTRCSFYAAGLIHGVKVGPSPAWLREHLESLGQKSINNIVDATNFVMLDLGTPLHVFDADTLSGAIGVRAAKDGEKITVLGGQEKELTNEMTVITDANKNIPIAIAGVKGGTHAELSNKTTNIIIEAAKFDALRTRRTATALNLKTDASKRFENNLAIELPAYGMEAVVKLILEVAGGELVGYASTELGKKNTYKLGTSVAEANKVLGGALSEKDLTNILDRFNCDYERIEDPIAFAQKTAISLVGAKYKADSPIQYDAPKMFSCSSFTNYVFVQAGVTLPSVSVDQYLWGEPVTKENLQAGDLIFFNNGSGKAWHESPAFLPKKKVPEGIDHVGLYLGDGKCIHSSQIIGSVTIESIVDVEARAKVVGYRRVDAAVPRFVISVPFERLDLRIPQDLVEEIGRVYGYEKIKATSLPKSHAKPEPNAHWCAAESVRKSLTDLGFSEVYTYTLRDDGEVKLANALTADKSTLRSSLAPGIVEALAKNEYNAPLLGIDTVKIFEIGNVFGKDSEALHVCVGTRPLAQKKRAERTNALLLEAKVAVEKELGVKVDQHLEDETLEFDISTIKSTHCPTLPLVASGTSFKSFSAYPFVLRDIALWVSEGTSADTVRDLIRAEGGAMLVRSDQFDSFTKDGRTSYAFHLVFQSAEKTLSDSEVNAVMGTIHGAMRNKDWEVR